MVAVLLLEPLDEVRLQMRQVAVAPEHQRQGIGAGLVKFAEGFAVEHGFRIVIAHSRESALSFYGVLGYAAAGEAFREQGIPHVLVTKELMV